MSITQRLYNSTVRRYLPRKLCIYNGVPARGPRLFDHTDTLPEYKAGLKSAIEDHVTDGDKATLVGGGRGVSSVWLARQGATVVAHEAAEEMLDIARETVDHQGLTDSVEVRQSLVGEAIDVYGSAAQATVISPDQLKTGDVLVLDCEGAERSILGGLSDLPPTIVVETHPEFGVPVEETAEVLREMGYSVESRAYEPGRESKRVLTGEKRLSKVDSSSSDSV